MRRCRSLPGYAVTLALGACFSPTGSVFTSQTTATGDLTGEGPTGPTGSTGPTDSTTGGPASTDASAEVTASGPIDETTTDAVTGSSTGTTASTDPAVCGDFVIGPGEQCDDGPLNGDDRACTSACQDAVCGDGLVCTTCTVAEECDGPVDDLGCGATCLFAVKYAFVTSARHGFDFGGVDGADALCRTHATGNFHPQREFVAWLSGPEAVKDRLAPTDFRYVLRTGVTIADSPADLLDGSLDAPIEVDEQGVVVDGDQSCVPNSSVWTGTNEFGEPVNEHCDHWSAIGAFAQVGNAKLTDQRWTKNCVLQCNAETAMRLFCIEKG